MCLMTPEEHLKMVVYAETAPGGRSSTSSCPGLFSACSTRSLRTSDVHDFLAPAWRASRDVRKTLPFTFTLTAVSFFLRAPGGVVVFFDTTMFVIWSPSLRLYSVHRGQVLEGRG